MMNATSGETVATTDVSFGGDRVERGMGVEDGALVEGGDGKGGCSFPSWFACNVALFYLEQLLILFLR